MTELKKGDRIDLTSGDSVVVEKELGRGGQGIVYLVNLNGEKKALKWYIMAPDEKFYKNLQHNILSGAPSDAFLWPEYLTRREKGSYGYVMRLLPQDRQPAESLQATLRRDYLSVECPDCRSCRHQSHNSRRERGS